MKTGTKNSFPLPVLITILGLMLAGRGTAQTFKTLHSFTAFNNNTNSDGAFPLAGLVLSNSTLYGTASQGGSGGFWDGTGVALSKGGGGFLNLHNFSRFFWAGHYLLSRLLFCDRPLYG